VPGGLPNSLPHVPTRPLMRVKRGRRVRCFTPGCRYF